MTHYKNGDAFNSPVEAMQLKYSDESLPPSQSADYSLTAEVAWSLREVHERYSTSFTFDNYPDG